MPKTITLRLSDDVYFAVKRYAETANQSMNRWVESVLDAEDMRRRCAAHEAWMTHNPELAESALTFHRANQRALAEQNIVNLSDDTS